ncbi:MAG: DNA polymerase I [Kiritimatiellae bacterium]|nr:DNA polymerase I [Kiritimatiellia bacterium]
MQNGKLFIIDMMPFLYKGHFVFLRNPRITSTGINTSALLGLASGLESILKKENPTHVVLAMDPGGPTFRHEAYPPYKAQRQKMPEDLAASIPYGFELAEALGIPVVRVDGFEADDVMGTIAVKAAAAGFDTYLATPDKDAAQLVRDGVKLYRPAHAGDSASIYDAKGVCEHWGLASPEQMIDYLALAGDSSDNIPGIKGVGEKTARDLLAQFGSVENIIANVSNLKGKLAEKVFDGREDAKISKFLTTIRTDVPIEPDFSAYAVKEPDRALLAKVCAKFELNRLAKAYAIDANDGEEEKTLKTLADVPHEYTLVDSEDAARRLVEELKTEQVIAFDTETAEADGHGPTEAHFAKMVGFSLATRPGRAWYVTPGFIDLFRPVFADPGKTFIAHNAKFDMSVLRRYGIGFGATVRDTMLAHYTIDASARHGMDTLAEQYLAYKPIPIETLIGEAGRSKTQRSMADLKPAEILDYAAEDADVALRLDAALRPLAPKALEESEEPLVKVLIDMEREGVRIDTEALREYGKKLDREILDLRMKLGEFSDPGFNPDSPKQLGELLFGKLGLEGGKKTSSGQFSTDEKTLVKLVGAHPVVQTILDYRACSKLKSTYVDKLPLLTDANGRIHTTYVQSFTETGRLSSSDPNLQNIPIRTERGKPIRKAFIARDAGHRLVSADYSQIELRLFAAFSKDKAMLSAFERGEDIHRDTASRVYGIMPEFVTPDQRAKCKMVNFGIIYGISAFGLSQRLNIPRREAADLIDTYFRLYPSIREYMESAIRNAREKGYAETILGRRRTLRDINSRNATARAAAERDAINTPIQGSAADLIKVAMVRIDSALRREAMRTKMVLQIHDELVFDAPLEEVDRVKEIARREMISAIDFGVPLDVGIGEGENWLDAH